MSVTITSLANISKGTKSEPMLLNFSDKKLPTIFQFYIDKDGFLKCTNYEDTNWLMALQLAKDCHNYNLELKEHNSKLYIEAIKDIFIGDEYILWFSAQVLEMMGIHFLKLQNFKDEKQYECDQCSELFEYPNPLKLHIGLQCDQLQIAHFWNKLENRLKYDIYEHCKNIVDSATTACYSSIYRRLKLLNLYIFRQNQLTCNYCTVPIFTNYQQSSKAAHYQVHLAPKPKSATKYSHHLCIYCGKWYSRKYGLKIHMRTHTGYKPLKCKFCHRPFGDPSNLNKHIRLHLRKSTSLIMF